MQIGTLVKNEEYGTLGIVMERIGQRVYVTWLTTPNLDPLWYTCDLEVLCK